MQPAPPWRGTTRCRWWSSWLEILRRPRIDDARRFGKRFVERSKRAPRPPTKANCSIELRVLPAATDARFADVPWIDSRPSVEGDSQRKELPCQSESPSTASAASAAPRCDPPSSADADVEWVAINDLVDPATLAHLLKHDSVYGRFDRPVESTEHGLVVDGHEIAVLGERDPVVAALARSRGRRRDRVDGRLPHPRRCRRPPGRGRTQGDPLGARKGRGADVRARRQLRLVRSRATTTSSPTPPARPTAWRPWPRCFTIGSASATDS